MTPLVFAADKVDVLPGDFVRLLPLVVLFALFAWLLVSSRRRSKPLHDRSLAHMDRLEAKTDEMVALLKEIRDKLGAD